jgi:hypothetical protein
VASCEVVAGLGGGQEDDGDLDEEADQLAGLLEVVDAGGEHREAEAVGEFVEAEVLEGGRGGAAQEAADEDAGGDDEGGHGEAGEEQPEAGHHGGERAAEGDEAELVEAGDGGLEDHEGHGEDADDGGGPGVAEQLAEADAVDEAVEAEAVEEVVEDDADDAAEDVAGEDDEGGEAEGGDDRDDAVEGRVAGARRSG